MKFGYVKSLSILIWAIIGALMVEGIVVEFVLRIILPHTIWPWLMLAVHVFATAWIGGAYVGMVRRPHRITAEALIVHDGFKTELSVPLTGIRTVRARTHDNLGRSGLIIDGETAIATVAHGESTVELELEHATIVTANGKPYPTRIASLRITVDQPSELVSALRERCAVISPT